MNFSHQAAGLTYWLWLWPSVAFTSSIYRYGDDLRPSKAILPGRRGLRASSASQEQWGGRLLRDFRIFGDYVNLAILGATRRG
jgi:hypothetical protein